MYYIRYSDLSVLSFVKIMAALCLSNKLVKYKKNQGLNARIPGYNKKGVRMGFGLHQGWAIEVIYFLNYNFYNIIHIKNRELQDLIIKLMPHI